MTRQQWEAMVAGLQEAFPKEGCGLLAGRDTTVYQVVPMANTDASPISYTMDPLEQLRAEKMMRQEGWMLVGIYHSHTGSDAYPSPTDVRLSISPDISYVVVSLQDRDHPEARSFRIVDGQVSEEDLQVSELSV